MRLYGSASSENRLVIFCGLNAVNDSGEKASSVIRDYVANELPWFTATLAGRDVQIDKTGEDFSWLSWRDVQQFLLDHLADKGFSQPSIIIE